LPASSTITTAVASSSNHQHQQPPFSAALFIVLWRHRLCLSGYRKPRGLRLIVIGPTELVVDENEWVLILMIIRNRNGKKDDRKSKRGGKA
jgi:hypothetical protein